MIVAGFGCRAGATIEGFAGALAACGAAPDALAAPEDRVALLARLAERLRLPLVTVPAERLVDVTPTRSAVSLAARGVGSVAEAVALAAAGFGARLIVTRRVSPCRMVTCAIAVGRGDSALAGMPPHHAAHGPPPPAAEVFHDMDIER